MTCCCGRATNQMPRRPTTHQTPEPASFHSWGKSIRTHTEHQAAQLRVTLAVDMALSTGRGAQACNKDGGRRHRRALHKGSSAQHRLLGYMCQGPGRASSSRRRVGAWLRLVRAERVPHANIRGHGAAASHAVMRGPRAQPWQRRGPSSRDQVPPAGAGQPGPRAAQRRPTPTAQSPRTAGG